MENIGSLWTVKSVCASQSGSTLGVLCAGESVGKEYVMYAELVPRVQADQPSLCSNEYTKRFLFIWGACHRVVLCCDRGQLFCVHVAESAPISRLPNHY